MKAFKSDFFFLTVDCSSTNKPYQLLSCLLEWKQQKMEKQAGSEDQFCFLGQNLAKLQKFNAGIVLGTVSIQLYSSGLVFTFF